MLCDIGKAESRQRTIEESRSFNSYSKHPARGICSYGRFSRIGVEGCKRYTSKAKLFVTVKRRLSPVKPAVTIFIYFEQRYNIIRFFYVFSTLYDDIIIFANCDINSIPCFRQAEVCMERISTLETLCHSYLPTDVESIKSHLDHIQEVRKSILEALMLALGNGTQLLDVLNDLLTKGTLDSRPGYNYQAVSLGIIHQK